MLLSMQCKFGLLMYSTSACTYSYISAYGHSDSGHRKGYIYIYIYINDDGDISRQLRCLYTSSNTLLRKFAYCTQKVWFNFYCSELWCDYSMSSISKLRVAYNNVFRNLLDYGSRDSASSMFAINAIDTYEARIRKGYFTFRQMLLSSINNIVTCINSNTWLRHNYIWPKWDNSLYICHNY